MRNFVTVTRELFVYDVTVKNMFTWLSWSIEISGHVQKETMTDVLNGDCYTLRPSTSPLEREAGGLWLQRHPDNNNAARLLTIGGFSLCPLRSSGRART